MKKLLTYIIIIITLVGIFGPITKIQAAYDTTTKGKCTIRAYPVGLETKDWLDYTEAQCHAETFPDKKDANAEFVKWTAYGLDCVSPLSRSPTDGSCICQMPSGTTKDGKCVAPASITCTNPPTNNQPVDGCTPPKDTTGLGLCIYGNDGKTKENTTEAQCKVLDTVNTPPKYVWNKYTNDFQPPSATPSTNYNFLSQLPCEKGTPGCGDDGKLVSFDPTQTNNLGSYLNLMLKIFIGICAVLAVIMIVIGGIQYMTSELLNSKEQGRHRISGAIFGLVLALGSWLLLNTINPDLLKTNLSSLKTVEVVVDFPISGAQSRDGKPGAKIDFKKEACPAAAAAQSSTGVDKALILAVFSQETSGGANTGGCLPKDANMYPEDKVALESIVGANNMNSVYVSCASGGGHGGAIGLMQFRPTTWLSAGGAGKDPWKVNDALLVAGMYLKSIGADNNPVNQRNSACKYYSGVDCQPGRQPPNEFYGDSVMSKLASITQQIATDGCQ